MNEFKNFLKKKNFHKNKFISKLYLHFKKLIIEPIISIMRYYMIYNPSYKIKKKINFDNQMENNFFLNQLKKSKIYLEYGSGSSTIVAKLLKKNFFSIESDKNFFHSMNNNYKIKNYYLRDLGYVKYYSIPSFFDFRKKFLKNKAIKYSNDILEIFDDNNLVPDLVLIDGRYRVLTALFLHKFFYKKKKNFLIIVDDYRERKFYHVIEKFFYVKMIGRFGVLYMTKKKNTKHLIEKYSEDFR